MLEVQVGDVHFPAFEDELEHPYLHWFTHAPKGIPKKPEAKTPAPEHPGQPRLARGIYLTFFPKFDHEIILEFAIHLINETTESIQFSYDSQTVAGSSFLSLRSKLPPFSNIFLHSLSLEILNEQPRFLWQLAPQGTLMPPKQEILRIRTVQLVRYIQTIIQDGAPSFSLLLREDAARMPEPSLPEIRQMKAPEPARKQVKKSKEPVLDLHMSADRKEAAFLLPAQIQLLEQALNEAFVGGCLSMIVIHGIGSGKLREAVHEVLRLTPFVSSYKHEWMPGYGLGATKVWFQN